MDIKEYVGRELTVRIDQPLGAGCPVNCGRLSGRQEQAYVLGVFEPVETFKGKCIAVIHRKNDKDRLVIVPNEMELSDLEIRLLTWFQERFHDSEIWR